MMNHCALCVEEAEKILWQWAKDLRRDHFGIQGRDLDADLSRNPVAVRHLASRLATWAGASRESCPHHQPGNPWSGVPHTPR